MNKLKVLTVILYVSMGTITIFGVLIFMYKFILTMGR
jgi:hypothetical protein